LSALLAAIRKRLFWQQLIGTLCRFLAAGLAAGVLLLLVTRMLPVTLYGKEIAVSFVLAALLGGLLYVCCRPPDLRAAASFADRQGLSERVLTAFAQRDHPSPLAELQRSDAEDRLQRALPQVLAAIRIWRIPGKQLYVLGTLLPVWLLLMVAANPMDEAVRERLKLAEQAAKAVEQIDAAKQDAAGNDQLNVTQKAKLDEVFQQVENELKTADNPEKQANALQSAAKMLEKMQADEQQIQDSLEQLQRQLAQQEQTREAARAMEKLDQAAIEAAFRSMERELAELTEDERAELAAYLQEVAEQLSQAASAANSPEASKIAEQLRQSGTALQSGNIAGAVNQLQSGFLQAMQLAAQTNSMLAQVSQSLTGVQQTQMVFAGTAGSASAAAGSGSGQASSAPAGQSAGTGGSQAQGSGQGSGNQAGQGAGGGGSGSGHQPGGGGSGGQGAGSGSGGSGSGKGGGAGLGSGSHELVSVPAERISGEGGPTETVGGPLGEGDSETRASGTTQVSAGVVRPYEEVYRQYEQFTRESLERQQIPEDYKEMVRDYFQRIEP
jgi:chemotaxis protein histidine kinase CheA